ncbi:MAG: ATP synthase F1 subunit delta [Acidobacteria bacterium RIFCSPLOWO2_02_FULL_67_36]|nr:MAG: ATP synthase F1 subunit delta [Acidobacteria bacterium RIFCSPLOWO2_02_FULL_67_36]OFW22921.1 MAG: ATP synthase F1 subunit delta [Acidobacteria bacterium RIFCSPLOWO2_12_FULL_66_21]
MTSHTAATRYARALFDVALKESDVRQAGRDLAAFAALVAGNDGLWRVLTNPAVPAPRKQKVIEALLAQAGTIPPVLAKLLVLLASRDRLVLLPELAKAYETRVMQHENVVRAEVVTAVPLPADRVGALTAGLSRATGRQVQLEARIDPSIIGGAVTRVGSTVYDGSIATQLKKIKEQLATTD